MTTQEFCTYANCGKKAVFATETVGRCAFHMMLEADKDRRGALYSSVGWSDNERRDRIQGKMELLRQQMLNPELHRGKTPEERKQNREEALAMLRDYLNKAP